MPAPPERLAALQKRFSDHIRNPDQNPAPDGIEERRLVIYRRLFFNNLSNLFARNFPVVRKIVPDERWRELIRAFMTEHRATTPLFPQIGREFVRFLSEHPDQAPEWPWLAELAHWQFLATSVRNDEAELDNAPADRAGDLLGGSPVINPTLRLARFQWPVHRIRADQAPDPNAAAPENPIFLAVFRKPDDALGRMEINAVTARLLELVQENPGTPGLDCLKRLAREMQHPDPDQLIEHGRGLLDSLRDKSLILGTAAA